jgi:hypothetical protein
VDKSGVIFSFFFLFLFIGKGLWRKISGWWNKSKKGMEIHKKLRAFILFCLNRNGYRENSKGKKELFAFSPFFIKQV